MQNKVKKTIQMKRLQTYQYEQSLQQPIPMHRQRNISKKITSYNLMKIWTWLSFLDWTFQKIYEFFRTSTEAFLRELVSLKPKDKLKSSKA